MFGRVLNPRNTALGAGGSSGGEAALIAFRGALIGVGTDVAGSFVLVLELLWNWLKYASTPTFLEGSKKMEDVCRG